MKKLLEIVKDFAQKIVNSVFDLFEKTSNFAELSGHYFGVIGMLHSEDASMDTLSIETNNHLLRREVSEFLSDIKQVANPEKPIMTKGSVSGFLHESGSIFCFNSQFGPDYNLAAAVVYGHYHQLKEKNNSTEDDLFCDTLLLHTGQWQKKYAPDNEVIIRLAQSVFKPEALRA